ncbi:glycosyltransferase family 2 protein [Tateyamaria omphalii]|uniref:glycosyltransferase family 2 protein n=1 Tax=Tateyamaria omphalii TaxID=299262 RepID=UPI001672C235|nr:glycosyltransferase family 2 protein [Tateyamaria omphalii]
MPLLNGAAVFASRTNFDAVGGFYEAIFLYHENDDLSVRLNAACGPLIHVNAACVMHAEGRSSARTPSTVAFKAFHMGQSALYAMRKHKRPMPRVFWGWTVLLNFISPLNLLSASKRAKAIGFAKGVFSPKLPRQPESEG